MLEKFLVLLERFVVAHELIAANSVRKPADIEIKNALTEGLSENGGIRVVIKENKELPVEGEDVIDTPAAEEKPKRSDALNRKPKAAKKEPAPEPEDDLADEPEEKGPDLTLLRDEIKMMAKHVAAGESDKCADLFDELLEEFKVRTVPKLADEQVEDFHKQARALVAKYYQIED